MAATTPEPHGIGYLMRKPCALCGSSTGRIETRSGQDCVFCAGCGTWQYNAPAAETGRATRTLRTRPDIRPGQRSRVLVRDGGACVLCHRADVPIDVGHLISVKEGRAAGVGDVDLFDDENLAAMCASCNSGLSESTIPLRLAVQLFRVRLNRPRDGGLA